MSTAFVKINVTSLTLDQFDCLTFGEYSDLRDCLLESEEFGEDFEDYVGELRLEGRLINSLLDCKEVYFYDWMRLWEKRLV